MLKTMLIGIALVIGFLAFSQKAASQFSTEHIEKNEWPFLPVWCRYTQVGPNPYTRGENIVDPSPEARKLIAMLGKQGWSALHHYCWGLAKLHRSHRIGLAPKERTFLMKSAIDEIDYVIQHSPRNFVLRPEIITKRGYILLMLGQYVEAEENLKTAMKEQPTYWPPYGYLSDVYLKQGKTDEARAILQKGLKVAPNAKGLRNRMAQFK